MTATFDAILTLELRDEMAQILSCSPDTIKPCVAAAWKYHQPEGQRSEWARILSIELLRAGISQENALACLTPWFQRCEQPPKARSTYTFAELRATLRSAANQQQREKLRGYGCKGPLSEHCPYGGHAGYDQCPYIKHRKRPPKRDSLTTLVGAFNLATTHHVPKAWRREQTIRRRFLMLAIGAIEQLKGCGGVQLITSQRELEHYTDIPRRTIARDLVAMARAGWIEYQPGLSRVGRKDMPAQGATIRRLMSDESRAFHQAEMREQMKRIRDTFGAVEELADIALV